MFDFIVVLGSFIDIIISQVDKEFREKESERLGHRKLIDEKKLEEKVSDI